MRACLEREANQILVAVLRVYGPHERCLRSPLGHGATAATIYQALLVPVAPCSTPRAVMCATA